MANLDFIEISGKYSYTQEKFPFICFPPWVRGEKNFQLKSL